MKERTYTPQQMEAATRIANAIANIPEGRQNECIQVLEAIVLGAEIATKAFAPV